jgi:hypothetical protein
MHRMSHEAAKPRLGDHPNHEALPVRGMVKRLKDGEQPNPPMPWDFPLVAECAPCGKRIRKEKSMLADWEHAE